MADDGAPRYLVINRFDDECGYYHDFFAGLDCQLFYITLPKGLSVLDQEGAVQTVVVPDLGLDTVLEQAKALVARHGEFAGVVGMSERDVLMTALLREALGIPGWRGDFVNRFRDKPTMKRLVAEAGLRVPRFEELDERPDAAGIAARLGLPLVLKPRSEAASRGVVVVSDEAELADLLASIDPAQYECEEFVGGAVVHVDGVRRDGAFHYVSASEYINTCLDFVHGQWIGSFILDPGEECDRYTRFTALCLDALGLTDGPFHFELIVAERGEPVFLEVAIRPGGGEVAFIHQDLFGVSLYGEGLRASLGLAAMNRPDEFGAPVGGGWLLIPEPEPRPCRVLARNSMAGTVPEVYAELLPQIGSVLDGTGGYERIGGRFRLRGRDESSVRDAIARVAGLYELKVEPAVTDGAAPGGGSPYAAWINKPRSAKDGTWRSAR